MSLSTAMHEASTASPSRFSRRTWLMCFALLGAVACVFAGVVRCDFIDLDDRGHVLENPLVTGGLSWASIGQAFTTPHASLWVPLTWISWMTEISLFGLNPGEMHGVNLALHAASALLLFLALRRMTEAEWPSFATALLFGIHPLNVESVAWVAERKNVLCAFFWMLAMLAYARYAERPNWRRYAMVAGCFVLALFAKPMAVTLPCALVLLDFWPLRRKLPWLRLVLEKLPLLLLSLGAAAMQMHAVALREQAVSLDVLPAAVRLSNALVSYASYLGMLCWPGRLGIFYPHPAKVQCAAALCSLALLGGLSWAAWRQRARHPYLLIGWCWFLGLLVPMIGLVQAGSQARADRFTYLAQIGIFLALIWAVRALGLPRPVLASAGAVAVLALGAVSLQQTGYWTDSVTLFEHSLRATGPNPRLEALAANAQVAQHNFPAALPHFQRAVTLFPDMAETWNDYGAALTHVGDDRAAARCFAQALRLEPGRNAARYNLATTLERLDQGPAAMEQFRQVLEAVPSFGRAELHLGRLLAATGQPEEARTHLESAARLLPRDAEAAEALSRLLSAR